MSGQPPEDFSRYIGQTVEEATAQAATEGLRVRVLKPGAMYTMEYDRNRLNLTLGPDERVRAVRRG